MHLLRGKHNATLREVCARESHSDRFPESGLGSVVTIGNFDGVHLGHQAIIRRVCQEAKDRGLLSVVVIFEPQPMELFKGNDAPARLMRFRDKYEALDAFEIDFLFCLKFDEALSKLSAEQFVKNVLVDHLSVKHLVIGDDFRFGGDRSGDFELLCELGKSLSYTVENTTTISTDATLSNLNQRASSTLVRELLKKASFDEAAKVLGKPFQIKGRVVHGEKLGRQLGFPTANVALKRLSVPFTGVYAVKVKLLEDNDQIKEVKGVANIGVKPTVGEFKPNLEIHLFDFNEDIYGAKVSVEFVTKLRDEKRFDGIDELKTQIELDVQNAKTALQID